MMISIVRCFAVAVASTLAAAAAASQTLPGDQSRWSLDFSTSLQQQSASPMVAHIEGDWTSTISAVRAGEYDAQLQLVGVHFSDKSSKGPSAKAVVDLQARLSRPFWVTCRSDGGLVAIHFYRDVRPSDRNLLQMIATELQLVRPDSSRVSWTVQERDGAGEYSALYVMPQAGQIMKRKLKYTYLDRIPGASSDALHVSVDQSDVTFSLAADRRIQKVDGTDRVRMDVSLKGAEPLEAATEFHLSNLRTEHAPELIGGLDRAHSDVSDSAIVTQKPNAAVARAEADDRMLDGYTTDEILVAAFANEGGDAALPDRLTALFRQRPEAATDAVSLLLKDGQRRSVTNALGASGSPSAVAALDGLAHNTALAEGLRVDAILGFVQTQHPSRKAMFGVDDLIQDSNIAVRSAARMICGALARAGRAEHPDEAEAIDASLISLYRYATDERERVELLGALGNSTGPSAVPVIVEAVHDTRAPIRAAAARALRLAPGPEVDRLLATIIISDDQASVRADAIFAARFRRPLSSMLADALLQAACNDAAEYVRSDAVAVLRQNPEASQQIPQVLAQIARSDANAGIRRQAQDALATMFPARSGNP
jgi:phage gp36-like protein